jgi:hypothetical protein
MKSCASGKSHRSLGARWGGADIKHGKLVLSRTGHFAPSETIEDLNVILLIVPDYGGSRKSLSEAEINRFSNQFS